MTIVKRIIYGLCGVNCLMFAFLAVAGTASFNFMSRPLGLGTPIGGAVVETLSLAGPGSLLLCVAILHSRLLSAPATGKYIFFISAAAIFWPLIRDLLNKEQGFGAQHVVMLLALTFLLHDMMILHRRGTRLAEIRWK